MISTGFVPELSLRGISAAGFSSAAIAPVPPPQHRSHLITRAGNPHITLSAPICYHLRVKETRCILKTESGKILNALKTPVRLPQRFSRPCHGSAGGCCHRAAARRSLQLFAFPKIKASEHKSDFCPEVILSAVWKRRGTERLTAAILAAHHPCASSLLGSIIMKKCECIKSFFLVFFSHSV